MAGFDLSHLRDQAVRQLVPDRINQLARQLDHPFRDTILTPGNTLCCFVQQIAHGNVACWAVHRLAGQSFSDTAWCQARDRLPIDLIRQVLGDGIDQVRRELDEHRQVGDDTYRWRGHRLHVVDGTSDTMPDTPTLREHYGVPGRCRDQLGFPTSHLMLLLDHQSGLLIDGGDQHPASEDHATVPELKAASAKRRKECRRSD